MRPILDSTRFRQSGPRRGHGGDRGCSGRVARVVPRIVGGRPVVQFSAMDGPSLIRNDTVWYNIFNAQECKRCKRLGENKNDP